MDDPIKLEYERSSPTLGHSRFGVASVCMAAAVWTFAILAAPPFLISPFESIGNEKETKVAIVAGTVGMLLAVRALQDSHHKQILAILGLVLNGLAILAAWAFLPYV